MKNTKTYKSVHALAVLTLIGVGCASAYSDDNAPEIVRAEPQMTVFFLPANEDVVFESNSMTSIDYVYFAADGSYREVTRHHMLVAEFDHGTWYQDSTGLVTLISDIDARDIEYDYLRIYLFLDDIEVLPEFAAGLENFLLDSKDSTFTVEEVEGFRVAPYDIDISVSGYWLPVTREQLEGLLHTIREYLKSETKSHFCCYVWNLGNSTFLYKEDSFKNPQTVEEYLSDRLNALRQGGILVRFVHVRIDKKRFDEESTKPVPFLVFPELNESFRR